MRATAAVTAAAALLMAATGACDGAVQPRAESGAQEVWLATPEPGDQAMVLRFDAPVASFDPAPGVRHFLAASPRGSRLVVVTPDPLPGGGAYLGAVRWAGGVAQGDVALEEVARWDYQPRSDLTGYDIRLFPR